MGIGSWLRAMRDAGMRLSTRLGAWWRGLWDYPVSVRVYRRHETWEFWRASDLRERLGVERLFDLGELLFLADGWGMRLLLFRWIAFVDTRTGRILWQPLLWVGWETMDEDGANVRFQIVFPWDRGRLIVRFATSWRFFKKLGPMDIVLENWHDDDTYVGEVAEWREND